MELSIAKLSNSKHNLAQSFCAFVTGLINLDYVTHQFDLLGAVVPWNDLSAFNHCFFPVWRDLEVTGMSEFNGEVFAAIDINFNKQIRKLLHIPQKHALVFDLESITDTVSMDDLAFMYQSNLIKWYQDKTSLPNFWCLSILDCDHFCIHRVDSQDLFFEYSPGYTQFSESCTDQDKTEIVKLLAKQILAYNYTSVSIPILYDISKEQASLLKKMISDKYDCHESFDELFLKWKSEL